MSVDKRLYGKQNRILSPGMWVVYILVLIAFLTIAGWLFLGVITIGETCTGVAFNHEGVKKIWADDPGVVKDVLVQHETRVSAGDLIATIQNDDIADEISDFEKQKKKYKVNSKEYKNILEKQQVLQSRLEVVAPCSGIVQMVAAPGKNLKKGEQICSIIADDSKSYPEIFVYLPRDKAGSIERGMKAQILPSYLHKEETGYLDGIVVSKSTDIVTKEYIVNKMGKFDYVDQYFKKDDCIEIVIRICKNREVNDDIIQEYQQNKNDLTIANGEECDVYILEKERHPYEFIQN